MSRLNSCIWHDLTRKLSDKFLGPYKILALPGTHSITLWLLDSLRTVHPIFHISMLEPATPNPIPDWVQPPPHQSLLRMNWNLKSLKSSIPRLTTDVMPASYWILSIGQGMRALMKKLPGSSLPSSDMLPNLLQISTLHIQPSLVLFQAFDLGALHFNLKSYWSFHTFSSQSNSIYYSTLS